MAAWSVTNKWGISGVWASWEKIRPAIFGFEEVKGGLREILGP